MKTRLLALILLSAALLGAAESDPAVTPAGPAPAPDRTVFAPRLPTPAELTAIAAAQGLTIERIEQTAAQVTVTTKAANGRISTVLYQLLSTAANSPAPNFRTTTVVVREEPEVIYVPRYRYYADPYYGPFDCWPPISLGIGLGWGFHGGYGHGYHGWRHH